MILSVLPLPLLLPYHFLSTETLKSEIMNEGILNLDNWTIGHERTMQFQTGFANKKG